MDRRIAHEGGEIAITQTELDLMGNSNRLGIQAIADALGNNTNAIVSGVSAVISPGNNVTVQNGWVLLNGELLQVDAGVIERTTTSDLYRFERVSTTDDIFYSREFRDGQTRNVAEINRAVPVNVTSLPAGSLSVTGNTLLGVITEGIQVQPDYTETDPTAPAFIRNKPIGSDVRNVGSFSGLDISGNPVNTSFTVTGDIISAVKVVSDGDNDQIRVTMDNPMANNNYFVRHHVKSSTGNLRSATLGRMNVFRPISTTQFTFSITEDGGGTQDLEIYFEVVQI